MQNWPLRIRIVARLKMKLHRFLWGADIDPSALIDPSAYIDRTWPKGVHIGAGCRIGRDAIVLTHDMTRGLFLDTRIGENTVMGAKSIVMPGLTIGKGCVIKDGAVVTKDMPDRHVAEGNPARITALESDGHAAA